MGLSGHLAICFLFFLSVLYSSIFSFLLSFGLNTFSVLFFSTIGLVSLFLFFSGYFRVYNILL